MFTRATRGSCLSVLRYLVLNANYADTIYFGQPVLRGELCVSWPTLIDETGLSEKQVRTALKNLHGLDLISRKGAVRGADRTSLYLIERYEDWTTLPQKGRAEGRTGGASGADPLKNQGEPKEEKREEVGAGAPPPRRDPLEVRLEKLKASPYWERIDAMCTWFVDLENMPEQTPADTVLSREEVEKILRIDMKNAPGCVERLGRAVMWGTKDEEFWKKVLRSLAGLRKKGKGGAMKWVNLEQAMLHALGQEAKAAQTPTERTAPTDDSQLRFIKEMPAGDATCVCEGIGYLDTNGQRGYCPHCEKGQYLSGRKKRV